MGTLTVRELENVTLDRLQERARRSGHTVEAEAGAILNGAVGSREESPERDDRPPSAGAEDLEDWMRGTWDHQG